MIIIERNTDIKIKCHKCGNEYQMSMMRMESNRMNLVCKNCLERKPVQKQETTTVTGTKSKKQSNASERTRSQLTEPSFKEYFCKACKFSFKRAKHLTIRTCPYCGSSGSIMVKGSTAKIIADAAKMKEDFRW